MFLLRGGEAKGKKGKCQFQVRGEKSLSWSSIYYYNKVTNWGEKVFKKSKFLNFATPVEEGGGGRSE